MKNKRILVFETHTVLQVRTLCMWWDVVAYPTFSRVDLYKRIDVWATHYKIPVSKIIYR